MACDLTSQPCMVNKSSSGLNITILVVDDDCATLSIVSSMLKLCKFTEFSLVDLKVATAENPSAAMSTLRTQKGFDLVLTDLHMPGMDGIQLKKQIDREFKLPVVVMSADTSKNVIERTLACGALQFMKKPITGADMKKIWAYAMAAKKGKSIMIEEDNNSLVPMKTIPFHDSNSSSSSSTVNTGDEDPDNNNNNNDNKIGGCKNSKKDRKRKSPSKGEDDDGVSRRAHKRAKVVWTNSLHNLFLQAMRHIGLEKAVPKKILEFMNVPGLTRENVASHLQKYRIFLKKVAERGIISSNRALTSNFSYGLSFNNTSHSHRPFRPSTSRQGFAHLPRRRQSVFNTSSLHTSTHPTRPSYRLGVPNSYGTNLLSGNTGNAGNFGFTTGSTAFQTPKQPPRSNLFNLFKPISANHGSGFGSSSNTFDKFGTGKNSFSSCLNTYNGSNTSGYGNSFAGIQINNNAELAGIGSMKHNGAGSSSGTAAGLGANMSSAHGFGYTAQEGSSSNPFGFPSMPNNFGPNNDFATDDLAAIVGDEVFAYSEFDKLSLTGVDRVPCNLSNLSFNFNQKPNDEIGFNPVSMDMSNDNEDLFADMNQFLDDVPNEVNLSGTQEIIIQPDTTTNANANTTRSDDQYEVQEPTAGEIFMETTFDPVWTDELFKSFMDDNLL